MELRKLIAFGKATYSITLPKKWVKENSLNKGDLILISEKSPEKLEISPKLSDQQEPVKEITLNIDGKDYKELERELVAAYINEYSIINLTGNLKGKVGEIRRILNELIGLEIMEVSTHKIITKVFSDVTNTEISKIIQRISLITKTMFDDLQSVLEGKIDHQPLRDSDKEINRQTYFATRVLTKAIKSAYFRGAIKIELMEAVFALQVIDCQERVADRLKDMARQLSQTSILKKATPEQINRFKGFLENMEATYEKAVKAYLGKNRRIANEAIGRTTKIREELNNCIKEQCTMAPIPYMASNLCMLASLISDLSMAVYNSEF